MLRTAVAGPEQSVDFRLCSQPILDLSPGREPAALRKESLAREQRAEQHPIVNLSRLVREAAAAVLPLAEARGRELAVEVPDSVQVRGKSDDLRDMVRNLLENAVLHGHGKISARIEDPGRDCDLVTIEVVDEGPGVPEGQEESVFQRFRRLNTETPGSGLGLAIVRHVVRSHGGDAHFLPGLGCVVVHLPMLASSGARRERTVDAVQPGE